MPQRLTNPPDIHYSYALLSLVEMAGEGEKLSGLSKIFNGNTMAGRANVSRIAEPRSR